MDSILSETYEGVASETNFIHSTKEKNKEIWLRPMSKTPIQTENSKTNGQHKKKRHQKSSITQRLRTDLGRSVGVIQLVLLNRFTGIQPSH